MLHFETAFPWLLEPDETNVRAASLSVSYNRR